MFVDELRRENVAPSGLSRPLLVDHIPGFLDEVVEELEQVANARSGEDAVDTSATARKHGKQRWSLGYDLEALIREYGILRHCILQRAKDAGAQLSIDEVDVLAKCLSVGVAEAATAYIAHRDQQLAGKNQQLEFIAEAGRLLSSSLDYRSTLSRLTSLLVPRLADWCAVHLEDAAPDDTAIAHVDPAKIGLVRDLYRRFPLPAGSPYAYPRMLGEGDGQLVSVIEPQLLKDAATSPEHLELLQQIASCSWMTVPLRVDGQTFGALTLAYSDSGRHYEVADFVLAVDLAQRAAAAIDNARLFDASLKARSRVEAATRAKDEFVAAVSHELRTPLNSILGWLHLMRGGALPPDRHEYALQVIERNAQAQSKVVADLLDISRIISGKTRIRPAQLDFTNIIYMAIEGVRPAAEAKRIAIVPNLGEEAALIRGDADRLEQVVWNLLGNAVKFTHKGGEVRVHLRRIESDLELTVEDTGEGIEPAFLPHVFEAFRQSDGSTSRAHGGLGVGLSIAKHIVELHGGSVSAESAGKSHGASFRVRLPVGPIISTTLGISRIPATTGHSNAPLPVGSAGTRVLVVDDDADARELVGFVVEAGGMDARLASSAEEGLVELVRYAPHVIISDIGMPHEDGYSFIRSIRTHPDARRRETPVIALTAFASGEDRSRALVEGFNLHLGKPVEPAELVRAVLQLAGSPEQ